MSMKGFFAFLILVNASCRLYGQNTEALIHQFTEYNRQHLQEKIYVHTDKNAYLAGDIVWFKLYCVNGNNHNLLDMSKVAYAEILSADKHPVLQAKIELKKGMGAGSFYLPVSVNSGNYILRCYTSWMKNYSPDLYFEKIISIANTLKNETVQSLPKEHTYDIQFFPEGGNLVEEVKSKIAFRVTDENGKGINNFKGSIINQDNDTVARFQPGRYGIGNFILTPEKNKTYRALITFPALNRTQLKELPVIYPEGYVMQVQRAEPNILVSVTTNSAKNDSVYLFVHCREELKVVQGALLRNGSAVFKIEKEQLGEGVSHLTVFNNSRQPVCERLYFQQPVKKMQVTALTDQERYKLRKKVTVSISGQDEHKLPVMANISMAVYRADTFNKADSLDIFSYLWLSSDLNGVVEHPEYYINSPDPDATDNLMLTHGWRRFKWEEIIKNKKPAFSFIPEVDGHIIRGRLTNTGTKAPLPGVMAYLSVPGQKVQLYGAKSNEKGELTFFTNNFYGNHEVIIQTDPQANSSATAELLSPFSETNSSAITPLFNFSESSATGLLNASVDMQVRNVYQGDSLRKEFYPSNDRDSLFRPYKTYMLNNYTRFNTIEEILREYVPEVLVFSTKNDYSFKMIEPEHKGDYQPLDGSPLLLVDGVPVFDANRFIHYNPSRFQKLQTLNKNFYSGQLIANGIISFTSYKGDLSGTELDPHSVVVDYEGIQLNREFYSPRYDTDVSSARIPDFRTTLLWAPDIHTDTNGTAKLSFYTSDKAGDYLGVIEGITPDGRAGSQVIHFTVDANPQP